MTDKSKRQKEYMKNYYLQNKERLSQKAKQYYKENRDSIIKKNRRYYQTHRKQQIQTAYKLYKRYVKLWIPIIKESYGELACSKCGYSKNFSAIEFHHRNPEEKETIIGHLMRRTPNNPKNVETMKKELSKCDLLCRNCHAEIHYPDHESLMTLAR